MSSVKELLLIKDAFLSSTGRAGQGIRLFQALSLIIKFMFAATGKKKHTFKSLYGAGERFFPVFICVDPRPSPLSSTPPAMLRLINHFR